MSSDCHSQSHAFQLKLEEALEEKDYSRRKLEKLIQNNVLRCGIELWKRKHASCRAAITVVIIQSQALHL